VDDEPQILDILRAYLEDQGVVVHEASDGDLALAALDSLELDLVITDLSMLRMGGMSLCEQIRKKSSIPIIVLSGRTDEATRIAVLNTGADDFVAKPFSNGELFARIGALRRRISGLGVRTAKTTVGPFLIDEQNHTVQIGDREVSLTPKELQLLICLLDNRGNIVTSKMLLKAIWGRTHSDQSDSVRALVRQLRKKIEPDASSPTYIKTEPWIGYRFEVSER
jgi:two-component system KDP operon response regulator KdpE